MSTNKIRCTRCNGQKKVFKVASGYSQVDSGGEKVNCPFCLGDGKVSTLEAAIDDMQKAVNKSKIKKQKDEFSSGSIKKED